MWHDVPTDKDDLGRASYADKIAQTIKSLLTTGSFTYGIYGEWGSGKTSFLQQIQKKLNEDNKTTNNKDIICCWFNPWRYQSEEHLIIPLLQAFKTQLETHLKDSQKNNSNAPEKDSSLKQLPKMLGRLAKALFYGTNIKIKSEFFSLDFSGQKAGKAFTDSTPTEDSPDYDSLYYNLINELTKSTKETDCRFVIFIDDLDRCLPEKAIQLLEGLKVLLDIPNFIFVVALAKEVVDMGIELHFQPLRILKDVGKLSLLSNDLTNHYLEKIIQFPFALPPANPKALKEQYISNLLKKDNQQDNLGDINLTHYGTLIFELIEPQPRKIKRFINRLFFNYSLIKILNNDSTKNNEHIVIKLLLLHEFAKTIFTRIEQQYDLLGEMETVF